MRWRWRRYCVCVGVARRPLRGRRTLARRRSPASSASAWRWCSPAASYHPLWLAAVLGIVLRRPPASRRQLRLVASVCRCLLVGGVDAEERSCSSTRGVTVQLERLRSTHRGVLGPMDASRGRHGGRRRRGVRACRRGGRGCHSTPTRPWLDGCTAQRARTLHSAESEVRRVGTVDGGPTSTTSATSGLYQQSHGDDALTMLRLEPTAYARRPD